MTPLRRRRGEGIGIEAATDPELARPCGPSLDAEVAELPGTGGVLLRLRGELDLWNRELLTAQLDRVVDLAGTVVVDLDEVSHLAACVITELLRAEERLEDAGGRLVLLCAPASPAARVLRALGVGASPALEEHES